MQIGIRTRAGESPFSMRGEGEIPTGASLRVDVEKLPESGPSAPEQLTLYEQSRPAKSQIIMDVANRSIHSPFRYAGGKYYARGLITQHIPPWHAVYCEPFAGGASIFFTKNKAPVNILNDKDESLMQVYRIIQERPEELIEFLAPHKASKELHATFKALNPESEIERAGRWYYLNRTSYSGIMNMPNCYWGYGDKFSMQPKNWPRAIRLASQKLQGVRLQNLDFEAVIDSLPDGAFAFVDPPYYSACQDKFYTEAFTQNDHFRLNRVLCRNMHRLRLFITYDNCDEIKEMYSRGYKRHDQEWNYCIARTDDQRRKPDNQQAEAAGAEKKGTRKKGKELFILNY
jgi:DNA adenine methylase